MPTHLRPCERARAAFPELAPYIFDAELLPSGKLKVVVSRRRPPELTLPRAVLALKTGGELYPVQWEEIGSPLPVEGAA